MLEVRLTPEAMVRAVGARDPRFDGLFFVGITTTRIYCRPVCPARISYPSRRRFFASAAAAERAGFRPCLRCRPELAPGRSPVDAVARLAREAERRIAAGVLNEHGVADLAAALGVSERHLRRAVKKELGVSPVELAQTHRLLLAKQLLSDTTLPVTRIAYASGFQSLRRFNTAFRNAYGLAPTAVRRRETARRSSRAPGTSRSDDEHAAPSVDRVPLRLTLAYRPPFAWEALLAQLSAETVPGVDAVSGRCYASTVSLDGHLGSILAVDAATLGRRRQGRGPSYLIIDVSESLVPVLMPLLSRVRRLFDLDAEPAVIEAHLAGSGLSELVAARNGLRLPGALDGFEIASRILLGTRAMAVVAAALGEPLETPREIGDFTLTRAMPNARSIAEAGVQRLLSLGVPRSPAEGLVALAQRILDGTLRLDPGLNAEATARVLGSLPGLDANTVSLIVMRALSWPDAMPPSDSRLLGAIGAKDSRELLARAERWRPWRSYAAQHLWRAASAREAAIATRSYYEERSAM